MMWVERFGPIPDGLCVLHRCDTPECINPDHLWLGTNRDNILDKVSKGRTPNGETHWKAKLKREAVQEIKARFTALRRELAVKYAVSVATVNNIASKKGWRSIPDDIG